MEFIKNLPNKKLVLLAIAGLIIVVGLIWICTPGGEYSKSEQVAVVEDTLVAYPGRTFSYKDKFRDTQAKQVRAAKAIGLKSPPQNRQEAAKMRGQLSLIKSNDNYVVDSLTHSIPYLVPAAARELDESEKGFLRYCSVMDCLIIVFM